MNTPAQRPNSQRFKLAFFLSVLIAVITGCGGGSYTDKQNDKQPPVAVASALALPTIDGAKRYQARAKTQIVLTGKDSYSNYAPILTYQWEQLDANNLTFIERTTNAVAIDLPASDSATEYRFQLTVIDANGKSDTDQISVSTLPINDANRFLSHPSTPSSTLTLLAALDGSADTGTTAQPIALTVTTRAHWLNRREVMDSLVIDTQNLTAEFPADFAPDTDYDPLTDPRNPLLQARLPLLNIDDINRNFETSQRERRLDAHQIGTAYLTLTLAVEGSPSVNFNLVALDASGAALDTSSLLTGGSAAQASARAQPVHTAGRWRAGKQLLNTTNNQFSVELAMDKLRAALGLENAISANNYYALIDPSGRFASFNAWRQYAGFTDADGNAIDDPSISHALYLNNYDLGFGRDMWLRKDEQGNVYSYVTNYPSVESALEGRLDFAIVAMEYSDNPDPDGDNAKIVKFYAFVPDERTGDYLRVNSMNFDGRGEKHLPGVCTACHQSYQAGSQFTQLADADLDATFMPWDMDSFLFAHAQNAAHIEPTLQAENFSAERLQQNSRETLEPAIRALNLGALATYKDNPERHAAAIQLIHGWYGDADQALPVDELPAQAFNGNYIQPGWQDEPELYHQVFARNCRICHVQLADDDTNFNSYEAFINNDKLINYVFEQGVMPMARLTMDRFWSGSNSSAEQLRQHLEGLGKTPSAAPGAPVAEFTASSASPIIGASTQLTATPSFYAQRYQWALTAPANSTARLTNTEGLRTSFTPDQPGADYALSLTTTNAFGVQATSQQSITSADRAPQAPCLTADTSALTEAGALNDINPVSSLTSAQSGDGGVTISAASDGSLGSVTVDADRQRLHYQLNNPFERGIDTISYQLSDVNGSLSTTAANCTSAPAAGFGHITIDTRTEGTLAPSSLLAAPHAVNNTFAIALSWTAPTDITPTGYRIYRNGVLAAETTGTSYTDTPLTEDSSYSYTVATRFSNFESNPSTAATTRTVALSPANLVGDNSVFGQISLTWDAPAGVGNPITYTLYRDNNGTEVTLASLIAGTGPYIDTTVEAGKSYEYTLSATDSSGQESGRSNVVSNTAKPLPPTSPAAATISATQVNLTWNPVTDASQYKIYRKLSSQSNASYVQIAAPSTNSYSVTTGLSAGNAYDFRIGATVNGEDSITYATVSAITQPNAPTDLAVAPNTGGDRYTETRLTWTASTGDSISGYDVYRSGGLIASGVIGTSYVDTGRASGTLYSYTLRAVAGGHTSAATSAASGATYPAVPAPSASRITAATDATAHDTLRVSWPRVTGDSVTYEISASGTRIIGGGAAATAAPFSFADASSTVQYDLESLTSYSNYTVTVKATANGLTSTNTVVESTGASFSNDILTGPVVNVGCRNSGCHDGESDATLRTRFTYSCVKTNSLPSCNVAMAGKSFNSDDAPLVQIWNDNQYD